MSEKHTLYVNSTMNELHELNAELYEAMMDMDNLSLSVTIKSIKKILNDIQKSYNEEQL